MPKPKKWCELPARLRRWIVEDMIEQLRCAKYDVKMSVKYGDFDSSEVSLNAADRVSAYRSAIAALQVKHKPMQSTVNLNDLFAFADSLPKSKNVKRKRKVKR